MGISVWQIAIVAVLIVLLFGRGKISDLMGDVAKGITSFRKGLTEGAKDEDKPEEPKAIADSREAAAQPADTKDKAHG